MSINQSEQNAIAYCLSRNYTLIKMLGSGTDGDVWETLQNTAIKILNKPKTFETELECYKRLQENNILEICGFSIPRLRGYDQELLAIEMDIVEPPRILDFGKVSLDTPGDFSQYTMEDWLKNQQELWGEYWPTIRRILSRLRSYGIFYADPNPHNITPLNWNPEI